MEGKEISSPPLFFHTKWRHREGYQKCVRKVGLSRNADFYGKGFPLCAVIKFKFLVIRYAPRTCEIAKLLATLRVLYGDDYMRELNALAELEYLKMVRNREWEHLLREVEE